MQMGISSNYFALRVMNYTFGSLRSEKKMNNNLKEKTYTKKFTLISNILLVKLPKEISNQNLG